MYVDVWGTLFAAKSVNAFYLTVRPVHYVAALLAVIAGGMLAAGVGQFVRRSPRFLQYPMRVVFLSSLLIVLNRMRTAAQASMTQLPQYVMPVLRAFGKPGIVVIALILSALVVRFAFSLSRAYRIVLMVFFPFVLYTAIGASWMLATTDFAQFRDERQTARAGFAMPSRVVIDLLDQYDN
jgi:hypothetical protein